MHAPTPAHLDTSATPFARSVTRHLQITNATGLHLRAAAEIVKCARAFDSKITLEYLGVQADARSILSVACLAAAAGSIVSVRAVGCDASEAVQSIAALFDSGFGEEFKPIAAHASMSLCFL